MIAALHWNYVPSEANDKVLAGAFPGAESFVAGPPVNVQFMVKDSKKYAAIGGWGFADFKNGKPGDKALHEACFPCHEPLPEARPLLSLLAQRAAPSRPLSTWLTPASYRPGGVPANKITSPCH